MAQLLIQTDAVVKDYLLGSRRVHALRGVSVNIHAGEFVAVMGPSGSGKSTFMNLLGCLDTPTAGRYLLDDVDVSELGPDQLAHIRNEKIGFVFQTFNLLARTNALENVELPLLYSDVPARERRARARAKLAAVGLAEREHHHPSQLSGGQQQRVAIARALAMEPRLLLLDEVTSALDPELVQEVLVTIRSLAETGTTMLIVTHEMRFARQVSTRTVFMDHGAIVEEGEPAVIFGQPESRRLREFLSSMSQ
jgi:putative ABC transport system ATP-binding protein